MNDLFPETDVNQAEAEAMARAASSSEISASGGPLSAPAGASPRKSRIRSMTARPVRGFSPRASTILGSLCNLSWLLLTISTTPRRGREARKATVRSETAGFSARASQAPASSL